MEGDRAENNTEAAPAMPVEPPKKGSHDVTCVGVQFERAGKVYTFISEDETLEPGNAVMVESDDGPAYGFVIEGPNPIAVEKLPKNIKKVMRRATDADAADAAKSKEKALECFEVCQRKIADHRLDMKLIDAALAEGGKKVVFTFFAEQRVDFRGLVKDMANSLHMRIEMRQIGSRDESKMIGCLGPCGLETCCSNHMRQFKSISISMAKMQGLTPNPAKLTGMCGKLKCCLSYECDAYGELRKGMPKQGQAVETPKGAGKIIDMNMLRRTCTVLLFGGGIAHCKAEECTPVDKARLDEIMKAVRAENEAQEERMAKRREKQNERKERQNEINDRKARRNGKEKE